jgi:hypothetical protein
VAHTFYINEVTKLRDKSITSAGWAYNPYKKPSSYQFGKREMKAGDVKHSRLISCTRTQFLQLDSVRQGEFSLLSAEAAASNCALFTTERRGGG